MQHGFRLYPLIGLTLIAAASLWLERSTRIDDPAAETALQTGPDFTASHTYTRSYAKDGRLHYELHAESLSHFPAQGSNQAERSLLAQPRLMLNQADSRIRIDSALATVSPGGERVDFSGGVRIVRERTGDRVEQQLNTTALTVWPDVQRASSDHPVTLKQGRTQASALGLQVDNLLGTLELKGQVKAHLPSRQDTRS